MRGVVRSRCGDTRPLGCVIYLRALREHRGEIDGSCLEVSFDHLVLRESVLKAVELPQTEADAQCREQDHEYREADPATAQQEAEHTMTVVETPNDGTAGWRGPSRMNVCS